MPLALGSLAGSFVRGLGSAASRTPFYHKKGYNEQSGMFHETAGLSRSGQLAALWVGNEANKAGQESRKRRGTAR